jgi:hypothetical protein
MEKIKRYRNLVKQRVQQIADEHNKSKRDNVETQTIFDLEHDHFQLVSVGWRDEHRIYFVFLH